MGTVRRVLHSSDWHLGQSFHGFDRAWEHAQFLDWLLGEMKRRAVDALLVAGDIYDTANPSNAAMRQWMDFLARVRAELPCCDVVAIGGNHDSAQRLDAPEALTRAMNFSIVGSPRGDSDGFEAARLVVPLGTTSPEGIWGYVAAIPFLRGEDLGTLTELDGGKNWEALVRRRHAAVFELLGWAAGPRQAKLAMAHGVVLGAQHSAESERDVRIGTAEGMPLSVFPEDLDYLALGHLHRPQRAGGKDWAQYAGSPLPLHVSEADYAHRVVLATFEDGRLLAQESLPVPKTVEVVRIPSGKRAGLPEEALAAVKALPDMSGLPPERRPYLDVRYRLEGPRPGFAEEVLRALDRRGYRLTGVWLEREERPAAARPVEPEVELSDLQPEEVFLRLYRERFPEKAPSEGLLRAFRELLHEVQAGLEVKP
jgi:exonuclease SbcD